MIYAKVRALTAEMAELEGIMSNTVDEFVESLVAATINDEIKWDAGSDQLVSLLEEVYGNADRVYSFVDEEADAHVVVATYQYYEGEVASEEFIQEGVSILLIDKDDFEILNEVTDDDAEDSVVFEKLMDAIEEK